jgi:hypothetical protein
VDLGENVEVSRVVIYNRNDGDATHASLVSGRLSNSVVSLLNYQGNSLKTYRIGDATNMPVFDIFFSGINGVLITKAHKVRVQLESTNSLHMREVQVYDTSGVNRALYKSATQSSTNIWHSWGSDPASKAVNGNLNDYSHTNSERGNVPRMDLIKFDYYSTISFKASDPLSLTLVLI